ncbi:MAG: M20/M25/M40 family metallo-hydrolase [Planctomycetes bacterium]|nr:M20/M25/M40 family metallo-hydrolase [Planctomycetota bacterium]
MVSQEYPQPAPGPLAEPARAAIARLRARPDLAGLWQAARSAGPALADRAAELCEIPAPTGEEAARGRHVAGLLERITGAAVEHDEIGDLWVRLKGAQGLGPRILVSAHLDTVFPMDIPCRVRRENGRFVGPGIGDNCTGLSLLLGAAKLLCDAKLPLAGELIVAANVGEEGLGNLRGMRALVDRFGSELDATLALDGGLGHVVGAAVGSRRFRVLVKGPGGHSWSDFGRPSAVHQLARIAAALSDLQMPETPRSTFNIGELKGGTSINTIAPEAELLLDLRSLDPKVLDLLEARARAAIAKPPLPEGLTVEISVIGERPAGDPACTLDWVDVARAGWSALQVPFRVSASSTDANIPIARGLRASTLGTHVGGRAHTVEEWIDTSTLAPGLEGLLLALLAGLELFPAKAKGGAA